MFLADCARWTCQDLRIRRTTALWLAVMPLFHVAGSLWMPYLRTAPSLEYWVLYYEYPFSYIPIFIFWLTSVAGRLPPYVIVRRYRSRLEILLHQMVTAALCALLYTGVICVVAGILFWVATGRSVLAGYSAAFVVSFYLCMALAGIACQILSLWWGRVFATIVVLAVFITDRFSTQIITRALWNVSAHPLLSMAVPAGFIVALAIVGGWRVRRVDIF